MITISNSLKTSIGYVLLFLCVNLNAQARSDGDDIKAIQKMTISAVIKNIENGHFRPKAIDDNFSKAIWSKYLLALDPNKNVLLQTDRLALKKYELSIDDELHQGSADFFNAAYGIYQQRLHEAALLYKEILAKPFNMDKNETVQLNGSMLDLAANKIELKETWRKRLKYYVLKKLITLQEEKEKANPTQKLNKADLIVLEKEARQKIEKWLDDSFKNLMAPSTMNEKFSQYINTITFEIDPHTSYFEPVKARNVNEQMAKRYFGIGLELMDKEGDVMIKALRPGGAAIKSGLLDVNDRILRISDRKGTMVDLAGMPITEVANLIRGDKDTEVALGLRKASGIEKTVSLKRTEIKEEESTTRSAIIQSGGKKIGYIYLPEFYADFQNPQGAHCAADVERELGKLNAQKVSGIIIDLRNNGGGSLEEVVKMTGYFLGKGPKVQVNGKEGLKIYTSSTPLLYDGPLAVMINENSASASEIFAAAIQDYKRGLIIGSTSTYGKGTAQATLPMGKLGDKTKGTPNLDFGSLRLSMHQFYRVSGASTQLKGVKADIVLPGNLQYLKIREQDNTTALGWDSIAPANYLEWSKPLITNNMLSLAKQNIGKNTNFTVINKNSELLAQHTNDLIELNISKFKQQQATLLSYTKNMEKAMQLPEGSKLKLYGTWAGGQQPEAEWYTKWITSLSTDMYIGQTLNVMNSMISQSDH